MLKLLALIAGLFCFLPTRAQDFSNKGKDFWIAYGNHVRMWETITAQNQAEKMELYMTSDVNTTGKVTIPGINFAADFTVTAGQITTIEIPRSAGLVDENTYNLGIHVTAARPIVVYSFIYVNAVSGATLCLPVVTLGREYYSLNFTQVSNNANSYSYFNVIATDTGVTTVEIIPSQNTKGGHLAGIPYTVNLNQGQVYQALGMLTSNNNPFRGVDLTGSQIRSVATATTKCKKIAVFCGSGKISIGCTGSGTSDNLYQQMYPVSTWGKTYVTVPSMNNGSTSNQYNYYRVFKSDPTATVKVNGTTLANGSFVNGQYYEFNVNQPSLIESDKPVLVAQYFGTGGCNGNAGNGDPEMIYLNPVEQTISGVTLNSMQPAGNTNINEHRINVVLKNSPEIINSFKIDGAVAGKFQPLPANPAYAYAQIVVTRGTHKLDCDSGFNATAYGFGNAESYGYSAGTNLKDLYQFVSIRNQYATVNFPAGCRNSPFEFSMTFPYRPNKLTWKFRGLFADTVLNAPSPDSSWLLNGRTLYRYTLKKKYSIAAIGTYPISIVADNPISDGCSGEQEIDYDLQIFDRPSAAFTVAQTGCITDPVVFSDSTNGGGRPVVNWSWKFGDGATSGTRNPTHNYVIPGNMVVTLAAITDVGCLSDTVSRVLRFTASPVAAFNLGEAACLGNTSKFVDASTPVGGGLAKWSWNFGDGSVSTVQNPGYLYKATGNYLVKLDVETSTGCKSSVSKTIAVNLLPKVNFGMPEVCLNDPFALFSDSSTIADNSGNLLSYAWNFGDQNATAINPNTSVLKTPSHQYIEAGIYKVSLRVTSKDGCVTDTVKNFTVNGGLPKADFLVNSSGPICSNRPLVITDKSSVDFGSVTRVEIYWDYSNDPTANTMDDNPVAGKTYSHQYPPFGSPATKDFQVLYIAYSGASCMQQKTQTITVNASPMVQFDTILPVCQELAPFQVSAARELFSFAGAGLYSGKGISGAGTFSPAVAGPGRHTINYNFAAANGCSTQSSQVILVRPSPLVNAGPDRSVLEGGTLTIAATASANAVYSWSPLTYLKNSNNLNPISTPQLDITYSLKVTSADGCSAIDDMKLTILKEVKVPNAFSPNGDGVNDTWNIEYLESYGGATVEVFNRYGQLVYRSVGYSKPWDGRLNGSGLPMGTYYWLINPKNGRSLINGSVTIIR